jgi:hypothetical protein
MMGSGWLMTRKMSDCWLQSPPQPRAHYRSRRHRSRRGYRGAHHPRLLSLATVPPAPPAPEASNSSDPSNPVPGRETIEPSGPIAVAMSGRGFEIGPWLSRRSSSSPAVSGDVVSERVRERRRPAERRRGPKTLLRERDPSQQRYRRHHQLRKQATLQTPRTRHHPRLLSLATS